MTLQFWFEFASTYSYPAAMRIEALGKTAGVDIEWRPFLLGPLFKSQQGMSDSPFNVVPVKGRYMWRDLARICAKHGLAFNRPTIFPQNGLLAARVTLALAQHERPAFVRAVYLANFVDGLDISAPATIRGCLETVGLDAGDRLAAANDEEIKSQLRAETSQAANLGLFGAPSFVTPDGEVFWGDDRLEDALAWSVHGTLRPPQQS